MNINILPINCQVKQTIPDPSSGIGGDNQVVSKAEVEVEVTIPVEDEVPMGDEYTQNVNYQGSSDAPVGYSIPTGFGEIVPAEYQTGNSSAISTLLVGAQFVADHAVVKGLFTNSNHRISQVFRSQVTHLTNIKSWGGEPTDLGNDRYDYDVEIISSHGEKIRAQFSVESSVFDNTDSFYVDSFSFTYNAIVNGEAKVIELSWWRTSSETENYDYTVAVGAQVPETKVITENNLPVFGTTITNDQFLAQEGWTKIDLATINQDLNVKYAYQVGFFFVNLQLQSLPIFSALFGIDHVIGIYQHVIDENVVKYRFNVEAGEQLTETGNINYEITYDKEQNGYYLYSWSPMTHVIPLIY